jgi:hypothetical protein
VLEIDVLAGTPAQGGLDQFREIPCVGGPFQAFPGLPQLQVVPEQQLHLVVGPGLRRQLHPGLGRQDDLGRQVVGGAFRQGPDHHAPDHGEGQGLEHQEGRQQGGGGATEQGLRQESQTALPLGENR